MSKAARGISDMFGVCICVYVCTCVRDCGKLDLRNKQKLFFNWRFDKEIKLRGEKVQNFKGKGYLVENMFING